MTSPALQNWLDATLARSDAVRAEHDAARELLGSLDDDTAARLGVPGTVRMPESTAEAMGLAFETSYRVDRNGTPTEMVITSITYAMGHNETTTRRVTAINLADLEAALQS